MPLHTLSGTVTLSVWEFLDWRYKRQALCTLFCTWLHWTCSCSSGSAQQPVVLLTVAKLALQPMQRRGRELCNEINFCPVKGSRAHDSNLHGQFRNDGDLKMEGLHLVHGSVGCSIRLRRLGVSSVSVCCVLQHKTPLFRLPSVFLVSYSIIEWSQARRGGSFLQVVSSRPKVSHDEIIFTTNTMNVFVINIWNAHFSCERSNERYSVVTEAV